jgi:hypothetical protein
VERSNAIVEDQQDLESHFLLSPSYDLRESMIKMRDMIQRPDDMESLETPVI